MLASRWACDDFGRSGRAIQYYDSTRTGPTGFEATGDGSDHSPTDRETNVFCNEEIRAVGIFQGTKESGCKVINRQARVEGAPWESYGNVSFFEAIKRHAIAMSNRRGIGIWVIQCRCQAEPETVDTFEVQTTIQAEVLNPRKGT